MTKIVDLVVTDVRFPTSEGLHGSDAMHPDPDYSAAYVVLHTTPASAPDGHGLTFNLGRGTEVIVSAVNCLRSLVVGETLETITDDFAAFWRKLASDGQARWLGPEKGAIHLATAGIINAIWDLWAKVEGKPLWRLLVEMEPEKLVSTIDFRWIEDALTREEAVQILKSMEHDKKKRIRYIEENGYPAYTTSAGWLGYTEEQLRQLCRNGISKGWTHFKVKVGQDLETDKRRLRIIREEIGPDRTMMVDANQRWGVQEAIDWMTALAPYKPWFIEEPTSPDDVLGHAAIRKALKSVGVQVATGECCANRVMWKQFFQADAIDVCQIDSCRLGGPNEILAVLLMAKKYNIPVCPHAGGVGLCEYVQHLSMFDYISVSGRLNVVEYVDHLHEHFKEPVIMKNGRYMAPKLPGYSIEMYERSIEDYTYPTGKEWVKRLKKSKL